MATTRSMTLQDMRDFVRNNLDTDITDLPDALVDRFLHDGNDRIESASDTWSFRQVDYTFSVIAGTQSYKLLNPSRNAGFSADISRIEDVRGPNWTLRPRSHAQARKLYRLSSLPSATPTMWSVWADSLYLWPKPSANGTYSLSGYRLAIDWIGTAAAPDLPEEFHELVAWWALSKAHAREGDPGMAGFYADQFNAELTSRKGSWIGGGDEQPFVLNGGDNEEMDYPFNTGRLRYDWE